MRGHFTVRGAAVATAAVLACIVSTTAWAQQTNIVTPPAATPVAGREKAETYSGPNRALISTGLVTFGLAYVPAVIVAGTSPQPADNHLYIPVAGPWMNLADRPACGGAPALSDNNNNVPSSIPCDAETTNKVLLGVDGVFQGIGALTTLVGLLSPEREEEPVTTGKPTVHVTPARMGIGGYGISAFGNF
jgi:hypothetical protein